MWNLGGPPFSTSPSSAGLRCQAIGALWIVARIVGAGGSPSAPPACQVAADVIGLTGAGVMVLHHGVPQASLCSTGPVSALIEELQYTLGEGPCIDAYRTGTVIAEPNLAAPTTPRWPAFTPEALDAGARAVFGFPVRIGAALSAPSMCSVTARVL